MEDQKSKINRFLSDLVDPGLPQEEQVIVFSQDENKEAAGINSGNEKCINRAFTCGGKDTYNADCTNYDYYCIGASNGKCKSESSTPRNDSILTCGGDT